VATGATLQFGGGTHALNNASAVSSTGRVLLSSGTVNTTGAFANGGLLEITGGTFNAGGTVTTASYAQSAGTLTGTGNVTATGAGTLTGGTMTGAATTTLQGATTISGGGIDVDAGRILRNEGTATWTGASINLNPVSNTGSGRIDNAAGGVWNTQGTLQIFATAFPDLNTLAGFPAFNNAGTFNRSGTGVTTISVPFNNSGLVDVLAGTLTMADGTQGTGTLRTSGGTLNLANTGAPASTTGILQLNTNAPASFALGANTITVSTDYDNANFGVGNAFNRRANVSVTAPVTPRLLASGDVNQAITAGPGTTVNNGATTTPAIVVGNVRVGSTTYTYNIANTGTSGPALRGAIQDAVNGGNINDGRLSGNGVLSSNWGPIGPGGSTARDITITIGAAGVYAPISGQAVSIINNFENTRSQLLTISSQGGAAAYNPAAAAAISPNPIVVSNQRVGGTTTQALTIANSAPAGAFTEGLNAAFGALTGDATTNGGSISLLAGSGSNNTSMRGGINTATAGAKTGSITVNFSSDGTGTSGLPLLTLPSQTVNISGSVYQAAQPSAIAPNPVVLANQRVGGSLMQLMTISNTNVAPLGFQEGLNASFGATTGAAVTTGSTAIVNLAQGASDNSSLRIGVNTSTAGAKSGSAGVSLASNGTISGLSNLALPSQTVNVSGNVYQVAQGQINTAPLNFGTVQVGQSVSQALSISNTATGALGFVEDLNASFGASSGQGSGQILGTGAITGLLAGSTNSSGMVVSVNTATAGTINGSILVNFSTAGAVNGVSNGLGITAVGSAGYGVQGVIQSGGQVVDQANPVINTPTIALGNVRVGGAVASQFVSVTNQASGNPQAALNASISTASGPPLTATGSFNLLAPGATNANSLQVSMGNTSAAGTRGGTATVAFVSDASNIGNCAPNCQLNLSPQIVNITGGVFQVAQPTFASTTVNVAAARVGGTSQQALSVTNTNVAPGFQEGLTASVGSATSGITASGGFMNLAAGATNSSSLLVGLDTSTAGAKNGTAAVNLISTGTGTSGLADLGLGTQTINVAGNVYAPAVAQLNTVNIDFGIVRVGDAVAARNVSVTNAAQVQGLNDTLQASFGSVSSPFSGSGAASGIGAGDSNANSSLLVALSTANAGVFNGAAGIDFASHNPEMSDLALGTQLVSVSGQVNNLANPTYALESGSGTLVANGTQYVLNLGTLVLGSEIDDTLRLTNSIGGPADDLRGSFGFADPLDFLFTGWNSFNGLGAGQSISGLGISFDALTLGMFEDVVDLNGFSYNASDPNGIGLGRTLIVRANVIERGTVPEPDSLGLIVGTGLLMMWLRRRTATTRRGVQC